jgi:hypothetical protein
MEITQEERLDLTDEKIRAEKLAFSIELFKNLEAITNNKKVFMEKDFRDSLLKANCDLMAENQRLKSELDKQIKDNRKLVKVLKEYADGDFYEADVNLQTNPLTNREEVFSVDIIDNEGNIIYTKAQEVLKEVGEE